MTTARTWRPDWSAFDGFPPRPPAATTRWLPSWDTALEWAGSVRQAAEAESDALRPLLARWDVALAALGGDPSREDWDRFRPLRLSREEDWSDWLAYLLQAPEGQVALARLFGPPEESVTLEKVQREVPVDDGRRRADLVLLWSGRRASHLEVKLWDQSFEKTVETGDGCRALYSDCSWTDYILMPEESLEAWPTSDANARVSVVTWTSVCCALRRSLFNAAGSLQWRAFARAFCGAIEQKLLGVKCRPVGEAAQLHSSAVFRFARILREAGANGEDG